MTPAELERESQVIQFKRDLAAAKNQARRAEDENAALLRQIAIADERAGFAQSIARDQLNAATLERLKPSGESTAILALSDWHWEERVDPSTVNGLNEFSPAIAARRVQQVVRRAVMLIEMCRHLTTVKDLVVWLGGDMITGYLHEELEESNYLSPVQATLEVQDAIWTLLQFLRKETGIKHISVPTSQGNHGRTTQRKRISTGYANSYEWLMYRQL